MSFPCSGCGVCCRKIESAVKQTQDIPGLFFPYSWDKSGKCEKLGEGNKCMVYENRPLLCRIDELGKFFEADEMEWSLVNSLACNKMMDDENINLKYRIKV